MGYCNSRVQNDDSFIIVSEDGDWIRQHSPWTIPEIRPWYDHMEQEETWLLKYKDMEVTIDESRITRRFTRIRLEDEGRQDILLELQQEALKECW
jgi:hypothetical protein